MLAWGHAQCFVFHLIIQHLVDKTCLFDKIPRPLMHIPVASRVCPHSRDVFPLDSLGLKCGELEVTDDCSCVGLEFYVLNLDFTFEKCAVGTASWIVQSFNMNLIQLMMPLNLSENTTLEIWSQTTGGYFFRELKISETLTTKKLSQ